MKRTLYFRILICMTLLSCRKYEVQYSGYTDPNNLNITKSNPECLFIKNGQLWVSDILLKKPTQISPNHMTINMAAFNSTHDRIAYKTTGGIIYICKTDGSLLDSLGGQSNIVSMDWQEGTSILYTLSSSGIISFIGGNIPISTTNVHTIIPINVIPAYLHITKDNKLIIQYHSATLYRNYFAYEDEQGLEHTVNMGSQYEGEELFGFKTVFQNGYVKGYFNYDNGLGWAYIDFGYDENNGMNIFQESYYLTGKRFADNVSMRLHDTSPPFLETFGPNSSWSHTLTLNDIDNVYNLELE